MEINSFASVCKLFIPFWPYLKKIIFIENFFSFSDDKKVEVVDLLIKGLDEEGALGKYKKELMLSQYNLHPDLKMNIYILEYYVANKKKHRRFCKSLFLVKGFYKYKNAEVEVRDNILWLPFIMFVIGLLSGWGGIMSWLKIPSDPQKWMFITGCSIIFLQYIYYSCYSLLNYVFLKSKVKDFNFFITLYRLDKSLNKLL